MYVVKIRVLSKANLVGQGSVNLVLVAQHWPSTIRHSVRVEEGVCVRLDPHAEMVLGDSTILKQELAYTDSITRSV